MLSQVCMMSIVSHLLNFYHTVICLQQVYIVKVTRIMKRQYVCVFCDLLWRTPAAHGAKSQLGNGTVGDKLSGSRLICDQHCCRQGSHRALCSLTYWGCSLTNTTSIYGRPWCHGNWGIVCKTEREMERPSYTQVLIALYLKRNGSRFEIMLLVHPVMVEFCVYET